MLGRVMEFKSVGQSSGFIRLERLIERCGCMGVQIVRCDHDFISLWIDIIRKLLHGERPIFARALVGNFDIPFSGQSLEKHEQVSYSFPFVLIIYPLWLAWLSRNRFQQVCQQLFAGFIHAYLRSLRIIRSGIQPQNIFHVADKGGIGFGRDAVFFFQPRLKFVFLSVVRIVSCDTLSTISKRTKRSCRSRRLQRSYPSGASLHARAIKWASALPSKRREYSRSGFLRLSAFSSPLSAYAFRTFATVIAFTSKASQIASYVQFGPPSLQSDLSSILARRNLRAGAFPEATSFPSCARSWEVSLTKYFLYIPLLLEKVSCSSSKFRASFVF